MRRHPKEDGRTFLGWTRPGPVPPGAFSPQPGETLDFLSGHSRIFQYERGHRFSVDDLLTAYHAYAWAAHPARILDLGSGIGSISLFLAWKLPGSSITTLEAQSESVKLARKSIAFNGWQERFTILEGDLRDPAMLPLGPFDLVTGSPPYFAPGTVTAAGHPQSQFARIEKRGSVPDYAQAASQLLSPGGLFTFVYRAFADEEVCLSLRNAGLAPLRRRHIIFKEGAAPRISIYGAARTGDVPLQLSGQDFPLAEPDLTIRAADGQMTLAYASFRLSMGFPPGDLPSLSKETRLP